MCTRAAWQRAMELPCPSHAFPPAVRLLARASRYTGEDGFEISVPNSHAVALAEKLTANKRVRMAGALRGFGAGGSW